MQEWIADLRYGEAIEHRRRIAHRFGLHEILAKAVAVLVLPRPQRHPAARRFEANAAAEARRHANRSRDVRAVRDGHHPGDDRGHPATGRPAGRVAGLPRRRGVAVQGALGRSRHRVFRGCRPSQDVETRRLEELEQMGVLLRNQAAAQPAAELDDAAGLVPEEILDEKRDAAEGAIPQRAVIERLDAIRVGFDDGIDGGIDGLDRRSGRSSQFPRRHLPTRHQRGESQRIVPGVLGKDHGRELAVPFQQFVGGDELRLDVHGHRLQLVERLLHLGPHDAQPLAQRLGAGVVAFAPGSS